MLTTIDSFEGDGTTVEFSLTYVAQTGSPILVWVNGIIQDQSGIYSVSGKMLTFMVAPENGDQLAIFYSYLGAGSGAAAPDLILLSDLLSWANAGQNNPAVIAPIAQQIIDGLTQAVYWATGRTPPMLTQVTNFQETYNGSGSDVLYLLNAPIVSVASVTVNGLNIPASPAYGQAGYFVQQDGKSIALRSGAVSGYPFPATYGYNRQGYKFTRGRGNVLVSYAAGYDGCPADIYLAVLKQGKVFLDKRLREDLASAMIPQAGTNAYRAWAMQPEVLLMLQPYIRTAMANIF